MVKAGEKSILLFVCTPWVCFKKNYIEASTTLNEIAKLKDNWNNNGANSFSAKLIEKCRGIVMQLAAEPFICPTACGSIQFEYEKENGDYLELSESE